MTYLTIPCGRCNNYTLKPFRKSGNKTLSMCATCGKNMGVTIYDHKDDTQGYELYFIGGHEEPTKVKSQRLPERHWGKDSQTVIVALDEYDARHK